MALSGAHAPGATPLTEEDLRGLRIATIRTQRELNEAEAANIIRGQDWALRARIVQLPQILTDRFVQRLHKALFGEVWRWAGTYRTSDTNIGVHYPRIREQLHLAYSDALAWHTAKLYTPQEYAVRLHYRMVAIHPFRNGNGRHARMLGDIVLVRCFNADPLSWGRGLIQRDAGARRAYIDALRAADAHDFTPLLRVARA